MKLLYHKDRFTSPFLKSIESLGEQSLDMAAPYISVCMLKDFNPDRVITDVTEWLSAESKHQCCLEFVRNNPGTIRHCPRLHAKIAIGKKALVFGSMNFTGSGLQTNEEFGALVTQRTAVAEAARWFESLWDKSVEVTERDMILLIERWKKFGGPVSRTVPRFNPTNPVREPTEEERSRFLGHLRRFSDAKSARTYFNLLRGLFTHFDLAPGDPVTSTSVPQSYREATLPVNIGSRRVIGYRNEPCGEIGVAILKADIDRLSSGDGVAHIGMFQNRFERQPEMSFIRFQSLNDFAKKKHLIAAWYRAIENQIESGHRADLSCHNNEFLKWVIDADYAASQVLNTFRKGRGRERLQ